jgi:outer membrane protein OmpA-like peptidoglycan-associated protein
MLSIRKTALSVIVAFIAAGLLAGAALSYDRDARRQEEIEEFSKEFSWWPTDATPAPVQDAVKGGYWWWPTKPGKSGPLWGNRGYCYVNKVIFDIDEDELPPPKHKEMRRSLLIKKAIRNVKIYFDFNAAGLRDDAIPILEGALGALKRNPKADVLITGNCDLRGSEAYNEKLGRRRAEAVERYMLDQGIPQDRIRILSRGKLDAVAHIADLIGMQKDRNAQFMVAEVEEVMLPYEGEDPEAAEGGFVLEGAKPTGEGNYIIEETELVESAVKVSTKEYTIRKNDTLWKIATRELGSGHRWKYLYEINKDRIESPSRLRVGTKIIIPVE